jgi:hypothetical protein
MFQQQAGLVRTRKNMSIGNCFDIASRILSFVCSVGRCFSNACSKRAVPRRAASIAAMSIFFIFIIASNARLAAARSGSTYHRTGNQERNSLSRCDEQPLTALMRCAQVLLHNLQDCS